MFRSGHLAEAQAWAARALDRLDQKDSVWAPRFLVEEAKIRLYQGQSPEAIRLIGGAWSHATSDKNLEVERLLILALANSRTGDEAQARKFAADAERLCDQQPLPITTQADLRSTQGILAFDQDRPEEAKKLFVSSLDAARAAGDRFREVQTLINLSAVDLQLDHYEDAIAQLQAATAVGQEIGSQQSAEIAQGNAGWAYYGIGDYQRALINFKAAASNARKLGSAGDEAVWLNTAGIAETRLGDAPAARTDFDRALVLAGSLKNQAQALQVDQSLANLALHTSRWAEAEKYIDAAQKLARQTGSSFDIQLAILLRAHLLMDRREFLDAQLLLLDVERQQQQQKFPTIQFDAQRTLAQILGETGNKEQAETWFLRSIATYREQRSQLQTEDARLPFFANGRDLYMDYAAFLIRNHRADDALAVIDQGRAETLAEGLGEEGKNASIKPRKLSLTPLARQAHAVILVYALAPQGSYLWAANSKESGFYTLPDRAEVLAQIASHRRAVLAARDLLKEQNSAARDLYDMLVKPAEHLIHPGDRVFIVADDGMHGLNFESLLTPGESSHYWIEDVTITNLASLRLLAPVHRPARESDPPQRLLVIGNPVYSGNQYAPLPNAAAEVTDVAAHFPANAETVLTGTHAAPDAYLRSEPSRFDYIHFVSHAVSSELVPLDSAVILSPQGSPDSAKLYARDILSKPLHADLVTISACQGSGVRAYAGEGLVGLAWAFLRAGSRNVIGALWDVSDASTPELMQHLYDGIAAGKSPDVSLRAAKLEMLHSRGVFRKPIYWSAFQLYSAGR